MTHGGSGRTPPVDLAGTGTVGFQPNPLQTRQSPDYQIEIAEIEWELSPKKKIRTAAYNGQIPGQLLRVTEGKPVTIEIVNKLDTPRSSTGTASGFRSTWTAPWKKVRR